MTEDQIERRVEQIRDALDARLMRGTITQAVYDHEVSTLDKWATSQWDSNWKCRYGWCWDT